MMPVPCPPSCVKCYGEDRSIAAPAPLFTKGALSRSRKWNMASNAAFAEIAALAGDPARAGMLHALMDGRR